MNTYEISTQCFENIERIFLLLFDKNVNFLESHFVHFE